MKEISDTIEKLSNQLDEIGHPIAIKNNLSQEPNIKKLEVFDKHNVVKFEPKIKQTNNKNTPDMVPYEKSETTVDEKVDSIIRHQTDGQRNINQTETSEMLIKDEKKVEKENSIPIEIEIDTVDNSNQ